MTRFQTAAGSIVIAAVFSPSLLAQWAPFKLAGIPRNADGKLNAAAPGTKNRGWKA